MARYSKRQWAFAVCLAALAGFVDAVGYLQLGGFFVSFMSGNSTRLAIGIAGNGRAAALAGGLIVSFVAGVVIGSLTGHLFSGRYHRSAIMALITGLIAAAAATGLAGFPTAALVVVALAMGTENNVFSREGEAPIGITYMTGTLVKLGQRLTAAFFGGERWAWLPQLLLWIGLVLGAAAGAAIFPLLGLQALWVAAGVAALLTLVHVLVTSAAGD
ncbi:MAG: YoaK family protein [Pararhizobium sp.]